jgi:hypothetical protein
VREKRTAAIVFAYIKIRQSRVNPANGVGARAKIAQVT